MSREEAIERMAAQVYKRDVRRRSAFIRGAEWADSSNAFRPTGRFDRRDRTIHEGDWLWNGGKGPVAVYLHVFWSSSFAAYKVKYYGYDGTADEHCGYLGDIDLRGFEKVDDVPFAK